MWWAFVASTSVLLMSANSLLITASKSSASLYSPAVVVLLTEASKFVISGLALRLSGFTVRDVVSHYNFREHVLLSLPATLYTVNNNLTFLALDYLSPPLFALLQNLKVLSTALLYVIIMEKRLTAIQVLALMLLAVGAAISNYSCDSSIQGSTYGIAIVLVQCALSGLAAVLNELMLKRTSKADTIHLPNCWLYFYTTTFSWINVLRNGPFVVLQFPSLWVGLLVVNGVCNGLVISFITKHLSSLTKVLLSSVAVVVTSVLAALFLRFVVTLLFCLGSVVVLASVYLYHA